MNIPLNIDWQQILLHLFNFAILAGGLYLLLYKPVRDFMEKRRAYYQEMEDSANEKLSQAKILESQYQAKIDAAEAEIVQMKAKAVKESEAMSDSMMKSAQQQSKKLIQEAKLNAQREHNRILSETREEITQIAVEAAKKLLEEDPSKIYDEFLNAAATAKEQSRE